MRQPLECDLCGHQPFAYEWENGTAKVGAFCQMGACMGAYRIRASDPDRESAGQLRAL